MSSPTLFWTFIPLQCGSSNSGINEGITNVTKDHQRWRRCSPPPSSPHDHTARLQAAEAKRLALLQQRQSKASDHVIHAKTVAAQTRRLLQTKRARGKAALEDQLHRADVARRRSEAARVIQAWWRHVGVFGPLLCAFKAVHVDADALRRLGFEAASERLQEQRVLSTAGAMLRRMSCSAVPSSMSKGPRFTRMFLTASLIVALPADLLQPEGHEDSYRQLCQDLLKRATTMTQRFAKWAAHPGGSSGKLLHTFVAANNAYNATFLRWKAADVDVLVARIQRHLDDLDTLHEQIRTADNDDNVYLPQIAQERARLLDQLRQLGRPAPASQPAQHELDTREFQRALDRLTVGANWDQHWRDVLVHELLLDPSYRLPDLPRPSPNSMLVPAAEVVVQRLRDGLLALIDQQAQPNLAVQLAAHFQRPPSAPSFVRDTVLLMGQLCAPVRDPVIHELLQTADLELALWLLNCMHVDRSNYLLHRFYKPLLIHNGIQYERSRCPAQQPPPITHGMLVSLRSNGDNIASPADLVNELLLTIVTSPTPWAAENLPEILRLDAQRLWRIQNGLQEIVATSSVLAIVAAGGHTVDMDHVKASVLAVLRSPESKLDDVAAHVVALLQLSSAQQADFVGAMVRKTLSPGNAVFKLMSSRATAMLRSALGPRCETVPPGLSRCEGELREIARRLLCLSRHLLSVWPHYFRL